MNGLGAYPAFPSWQEHFSEDLVSEFQCLSFDCQNKWKDWSKCRPKLDYICTNVVNGTWYHTDYPRDVTKAKSTHGKYELRTTTWKASVHK
jgi:hypothetical protein